MTGQQRKTPTQTATTAPRTLGASGSADPTSRGRWCHGRPPSQRPLDRTNEGQTQEAVGLTRTMTCRAAARDAAGGPVASASAAAAASPFAAPPPIACDWLAAGRWAGPKEMAMAMFRLVSMSMGRATTAIGGWMDGWRRRRDVVRRVDDGGRVMVGCDAAALRFDGSRQIRPIRAVCPARFVGFPGISWDFWDSRRYMQKGDAMQSSRVWPVVFEQSCNGCNG